MITINEVEDEILGEGRVDEKGQYEMRFYKGEEEIDLDNYNIDTIEDKNVISYEFEEGGICIINLKI